MLDHEKLDVYQCSIEFLALSVQVIETLPKGYSALVDQLKRASWSIPLNIAKAVEKIPFLTSNDSMHLPEVPQWNALLFSMF